MPIRINSCLDPCLSFINSIKARISQGLNTTAVFLLDALYERRDTILAEFRGKAGLKGTAWSSCDGSVTREGIMAVEFFNRIGKKRASISGVSKRCLKNSCSPFARLLSSRSIVCIRFPLYGRSQSCLGGPHFNYLIIQLVHNFGKFNTVTGPDPGQVQPSLLNSKSRKDLF